MQAIIRFGNFRFNSQAGTTIRQTTIFILQYTLPSLPLHSDSTVSRGAEQSRARRPGQRDSTSTSFASIATAASLPASSIRTLAPRSSTAAACSTVTSEDHHDQRTAHASSKGKKGKIIKTHGSSPAFRGT